MARPFWLDEPAPTLPAPSVRTPDVAIVGAGITGCSAALTLARSGLAVRVYDERGVAEGASGRNGGFALRGGAMPYDRAREWLGAGRAAAFWRWTEQHLGRMIALGGDALEPVGSLRLAADEEERDELRGEFEALRADGFEAEWRTELPGPLRTRFPAAIFHPLDASIQPARFVRRLAVAAAEAGADFREQQRVASLDDLGADAVVVATDGYPSGLLGALEGLIIPTRGQMIATEPLRERLFECPHYGRHGFDYWQQMPDGRVLAGGFRDFALDSEFTAVEMTTPAIQGALERFVAELVGHPVEVTHRWAGIFGLVPDLMPVVGRLPGTERGWVAGGYSGHGNVLGFACGDAVARAILGDADPLLGLFDPARLLQPSASPVETAAST
jgi:glycine/D-amino acid oxidase-like deaminating enzyme